MSLWLIIVPLAGALVGWLVMSAGLWFFFRRVLPQRKVVLDRQVSKLAAAHFSLAELEARLVSPQSFQKLLPVIELHIDDFLRHKLGKSMPFLSAFIGDKTINQLKTVFMAELADLFPTVMKNYFGQLQQEIDLESVLLAKLAEIPPQRIESTAKSLLAKEFRLLKLMGALTGLVTGLVQLLLTWLIA